MNPKKAKLFVYDEKYYHPLMLIIRDYFKVFEDENGEEKMIEWFKKHFDDFDSTEYSSWGHNSRYNNVLDPFVIEHEYKIYDLLVKELFTEKELTDKLKTVYDEKE